MSIAETYRIERELGMQQKRKFGRVFLVVLKSDSSQRFILKTLEKSTSNVHLQERLRNEATFSFDHPQLPSLIQFEESETEILLLLEYKEGLTLADFWKSVKKKERIKTLKAVLYGLLPALEILKEQHIVHCDIKPSNILVCEEQGELVIHLIDFGLALNSQENETRKILFPLGFAAPELLLNQLSCVDHTTDLFALGISIWRIFTGKLPLAHPNPSIFTNLQLVHPLPEHENIPNELVKILNKMCLKHAFRTAPNLLHQQEVIVALMQTNSLRFQHLKDVITEVEKLEDRNWINTILYGIRGRN
jgi:eukaryotic-like serine/threonine-protein kinase